MVGPIAHIGTPGTSRYTVDWSARQRGQEQMWKGISQLLHSVGEQQRAHKEKKSLAELSAFVGDGKQLLGEATKRGIPLAKVREMVNIHSMLQPKESDSPFENFFDPATQERKAFRRGSKEAESYARQGWLSGNPETAKPTQRRIIKGADDFNYYADDMSRVLPGVTAPPPKRETPKITDSMRLADEWQEATKPVRGLMRQRDLMSIGMEAAARGDMAAGSQTVLVTFQKILDPISVVRESEYARSASGQALLAQVEGAVEKLGKGGAGVTLEQLGAFARLADEAVAKLSNGRVRDERDRIGRFADHYGIDRSIIFSGNLGTGAPPAPPQQPAPTRQGNASDRFARAPWRGPPQSAPASMMAAQAQSRPAPGAVRRDQFGGGMSPGGRGAGDEFGSPFDASGLAPPPERRQYPFGSMDRTALMGVDLNTLAGDPAALAAYERAIDEQIRGIR